jgi:hypothetical protein
LKLLGLDDYDQNQRIEIEAIIIQNDAPQNIEIIEDDFPNLKIIIDGRNCLRFSRHQDKVVAIGNHNSPLF